MLAQVTDRTFSKVESCRQTRQRPQVFSKPLGEFVAVSQYLIKNHIKH
jgi:hypothetical protein